MHRSHGVAVAAMLLVVSQVAWSQSNVATGTLLGCITDPAGDALRGVTVTARSFATGFARHAQSGPDGCYRIDLLPTTRYEIRASLAGLVTAIRNDVEINLGREVKIDFRLQLAPVEQELVVTAEAPLVETTKPGVTAAVSDGAIANLPLDGRNFGDLVLLTPAAVSGRSAPGNESEIRRGRGGVHLGARAVHNSFNVDGTNSQSSFFGNERGGQDSPFTFSQAAIKELQVLQSPSDVQYSAPGGVINAITRSGTNELVGELFAYYADESFVNANALGEKDDDFVRKQYGFALGGPIRRDRLHFFVAYDGQDLEDPSFREFKDFPAGREGDWEALTGLDWDTETGTLIATDDTNVVLAKLDWQVSPSTLLSVRENWMDSKAEHRLNAYRVNGRSSNVHMENSYSTFAANLNSVIGADAFNELIVQYSLEERPRTPAVTSIPGCTIYPDQAWFGQSHLAPSWLDEERVQLIDNLIVIAGQHSVKAGFNLERVRFDNMFLSSGGGLYNYSTWNDFLDQGTPYSYTQAFSESGGQLRFANNFYAFYLRDEWRPQRGLTVSAGLRYDYQDHDQPATTNPLFPATGQIPDDSDNWGPRLGFAWDPDGRGRQVLRGDAGYYYGRTSAALDAQAMLGNGIDVITTVNYCFRGQPCPAWPNRFDAPPPFSRPNVMAYDPSFENPETLRLSLGYEGELGGQLAVGVDAIYSRTHTLHRNQDQNLSPSGKETAFGTPIYETGAMYPELGEVLLFRSDARSRYRALLLTARKRFAGRWFLDASYTLSSSRDQDSSERSTGINETTAEDQYNLGGEWGPSDFDATHKLVVSGGVQLPWNLLLSGSFFIRSGFPYTARHRSDLNGDWNRSDRAVVETASEELYHYPRNSERQPSFRTLDLRLAKLIHLGGRTEVEVIVEAFNALGEDNWWVSRSNQILSDGCDTTGDGSWGPCTTRPSFGVKDLPGAPRRYQLGLRFSF